jgi:DNA-binding response OmpR family regulator
MDQRKVLVIDDERLMVKSTCMALALNGFGTEGALDGEQGLKAAREGKPDIILADIMMPGMDGWQVLKALKEQEATAAIPVIIFTAREYSNGNTLASMQGAAGYIAKPYELSDLVETLRRHLP